MLFYKYNSASSKRKVFPSKVRCFSRDIDHIVIQQPEITPSLREIPVSKSDVAAIGKLEPIPRVISAPKLKGRITSFNQNFLFLPFSFSPPPSPHSTPGASPILSITFRRSLTWHRFLRPPRCSHYFLLRSFHLCPRVVSRSARRNFFIKTFSTLALSWPSSPEEERRLRPFFSFRTVRTISSISDFRTRLSSWTRRSSVPQRWLPRTDRQERV